MTDVWVERYRKEVLPKLTDTLRPSSVLFFGSRSAGTARAESDLDVIIVAEAFAGIPFVRRMAYVLGLVHFPLESDIGATKARKTRNEWVEDAASPSPSVFVSSWPSISESRFPKHVDYAARFPQPPLRLDDLGLSLGCRLVGYVVWRPTQSLQPGNT